MLGLPVTGLALFIVGLAVSFGFDREWGTYITREGKTGSQMEITINPSDLYPDCTNVSPVTNYVKTEKETANNSLLFDPKVP